MEALKRTLGMSSPSDTDSENTNSDRKIDSTSGPRDEAGSTKMKIKFVSMWNNVKYGKTWFHFDSSGSGFSRHSPVWLLGQYYHRKPHERASLQNINPSEKTSREDERNGIEAFNEDFKTRLWFTYRRDFEEFEGTSINSDCGWGCMIRSGQMLVANAMLIRFPGRDWRWQVHEHKDVLTVSDLNEDSVHKSIIRLFGDTRCDRTSPFSIHQVMKIAEETFQKKPGDWFGPGATAHLMCESLHKGLESARNRELLENFRIYVAQDTTVYRQDVIDLCVRQSVAADDDDFVVVGNDAVEERCDANNKFQNSRSARLYPSLDELRDDDLSWIPVLILIPVRLGSERKLNPVYVPCLQALLTDPSCVGVIGGRPKHSLYFVGFQNENLIHLDPHLVQDRVDVFRENFSVSSFHSISPRQMSVFKMDPSACFGFLITSRLQFDAWCAVTQDILSHQMSLEVKEHRSYSIFSIESGRVSQVKNSLTEAFHRLDSDVNDSDSLEVDDFVFM